VPTKLALALLLATLPALAQSPDTILYHGNILTGAHLTPADSADPTPARVQALAIAKGIVLAVGTDSRILKLKSPTTKLIDLHGAFALPGFNDAHVHLAGAGQQALAIDVIHTPSLAAMLQTVKTYAASKKPGTWLQGGGWDHTLWTDQRLPTAKDLDAVTGSHPTFLWRTDGHMAVVNTAALAAAHITAETPDPQGAKIDRDPAGNPTGILREAAAINLVYTLIPPPDPDTRRQALQVAIADALAHGVTSVQDYSTWDDFLTLETLEHTHQLHLRISEWLDFNLPIAVLKTRQASHPKDDRLLHTGMLKAFMDGSLGSHTAAMEDPYTDDPANSGIPRYDQQKLNQMSAERAAAGFQLGFHAIGDRANAMSLNAFAAAEQTAQPSHPTVLSSFRAAGEPASPDLRFRIEHAQVVSPGAFDQFKSEHVIASMQPSHLLTDMAWAPARLGPERSKYAYAWKSFLTHGVTLAFGTDYPVESINPFRGLYAAITRQNEAGTQTFQPQERLTINEALYAYTQASAYADFSESFRGRLQPGYLADLAILDRDITTATPRELLNTSVLQTIVNGEPVYTHP
jgi:predicted amidohydrolase YtcJ